MGIGPLAPPARPAVFLDRDGVLNRAVVRGGKPYPPATLEQLEILPGVPEAVLSLQDQGFTVCVVTNQPDVARGVQQRSVVESIHNALRAHLSLEHFYVCYHDDADCCECRKPKPGLLRRAAADLNLSLPHSFMVGDRWRDIDCGHAAQCLTIFIERGYNEPLRMRPNHRVPDLLSAAALIASLKGNVQPCC